MVYHMQSPTPKIVGSADAALQLEIDRSTLTRWVKRGKITPQLTGSGTTGEMFFLQSDIDALLTPADSAPEAESSVERAS
jgi:predicted site-specific integrase-resolvase